MTSLDPQRAADLHLLRAHAAFEARAAAPDRVHPLRLALGIARAALALAVVALGARRGPDPLDPTTPAPRP